MIRRVSTYIIRNNTRLRTFPKISPAKFNNLWNMTHNYFMTANWGEIISIFKIIFNRFGTSALIAMPTLFLIVKNSNIFSENDSKDYTKLFKSLTSDNIKFDNFIISNLTFTTFIRIIKFIFKVMWIPFKIALIFYILNKLGYDITFYYNKMNNLSLGLIDWYLKLILEFIKSIK